MSHVGLRLRTLGLPASLLAVLATAACVLGIERIRSDFDELETEEFSRLSVRVEHTLREITVAQKMKTRDWADWDDAARWLSGGNPGFVESNLSDSTLSILGEDHLFYWDTAMVQAGALPGGPPRDDPVERRLRELARRGRFPWTGFVMTDSVMVLATIREVRNSDGHGRRGGWLAMARDVDARFLGAISDGLQNRVWIDSNLAARPGVELVGADSAVLRVPLETADTGEIRLAVGVERPLHMLGREASFDFLLHFAGASVSFVVLALFLLERMVLARLMRLTNGVERIRGEGVGAPPVRDPRRDEIGRLSERIDEMVAALRSNQLQLATALERAQAAEKARVNFLASMTHELRTPLNGVIGLTEFALKSDHDNETREALELSRGAALGLLETINGVLEYARLEKSEIELVPEDAELESSIVEPVRVLAQVAAKKGLPVELRIDPSLPAVVRLDAARFRQVLNNLVGNAIKFTDSGKVSVALRRTGGEGAMVEMLLEVSDSGRGIPADRLEAIFEPFEQASPETAVKFGGTGLGLTIANRIAKALGGAIQVESRSGEGSRFFFRFSLEAVDPRPVVGPATWRRNVKIRLLLCDDSLREFVQEVLWQMDLVGEVVPPGTGRRSYGTSHVVVLDSQALLERHELSLLPPAANLLVLAVPEHVRETRVALVSHRAEIIPLPTGPKAVSEAIEALAIPKARVLVAVAGIVMRGMVTSMVERIGLVPVEAREASGGVASVDTAACDLVVVDLDDEAWEPLVRRCGIVVPVVGLADDPGESANSTIVAKPVQAQRLLKAIEAALEGAPEGSDSKFWPDSSGADAVAKG